MPRVRPALPRPNRTGSRPRSYQLFVARRVHDGHRSRRQFLPDDRYRSDWSASPPESLRLFVPGGTFLDHVKRFHLNPLLAAGLRVRTGDLRLGKTRVKVRTRFVGRDRHSASLHILQANALPCAQALPGFLDARKETCVILKPVVEPVVLRREPDEDPCRLSVTGDDHLPVLRFPQVPGEVVLDLRQRNLLHSGFPNRTSHDSASDFAMIASTAGSAASAAAVAARVRLRRRRNQLYSWSRMPQATDVERGVQQSPRGGGATLLGFFLFTFAIAWGAWAAAAALSAPRAAGLSVLRGPVFLFGVFAPAIAALALTARADGRAGAWTLLRHIGRWRVGVGWYLFAAGYMAATKLAVALIHRLATGAWPRFGETPWAMMAIALLVSTWVQAGEEVGWRGYALPRLARHIGLAPASILLG